MSSDLRIEFVPPSKPGRWAWGTCGALALACAGSLAAVAWQEKQILQGREVVEALKHRRNSMLASQPTRRFDTPMPYDADARTMLRELAFPTKDALVALENVTVVGVTPTTVDLQASNGVVRVQVEFTDQESLLKYVAELNAGEETARWAVIQARAGGMTTKGTATLQSNW